MGSRRVKDRSTSGKILVGDCIGELKKLATYTVRPFLGTVDGVANVQVMGGKTKEYWITLKPDVMAQILGEGQGVLI